MKLHFQATPFVEPDGDGYRITIAQTAFKDNGVQIWANTECLGTWPLCRSAAEILANEACYESFVMWDRTVKTMLERFVETA